MRHEVETPFGKHVIEVRFVIKNTAGGYFTEMRESGKRPVWMNGSIVGEELLYVPMFEAFAARFASQFDTQQDAELVIADSRFGGPETFSGCVVVPSTME